MSSSSDSSCNSSGSEVEESFKDIVEFSRIVPYNGDLEALAMPGEAAEQKARMAEEPEVEHHYQARFTWEVELLLV